MGYTYLYTHERAERAVQLYVALFPHHFPPFKPRPTTDPARYQLFPEFVVAVLMEAQSAQECFDDTSGCVKSGHHPDGIPAWKLFSFYFWTTANHPLGTRWTLSPENYTMESPDWINTYLGYSVEPSCLAHEFIPPNERPKQGYVMAKKASYLAPRPERAWTFEDFDKAAEETGIQFVSGLYFDGKEQPELNVPDTLPKSIKNYGQLKQPQFIAALSRSRVLIGVGLPWA